MSNENKLFIQIPNLEQGSAEWHEWRSEVIGASDAPAIMGENPWKSKKALIEEKLGIRKQFSGNAATRRGSQLEPEARRIYTSLTNTDINPAVLQSKTYLWQAASVDGINATKGILVEIKCGVKSYEYTEQTNKVPLYYKAQLQHILCVTGFESINYFSYLPGKIPLSIKVFRDEKYIQELISAELEFIDELKLRGFTPRNTLYGENKPNTNASSHAKQTLQNGDTFVGNFVNGKRNGYGVYTLVNGDRYEGNWIDGNRTGKGIYIWSNGDRFEGEFEDGSLTIGTKIFANGNRYEGEFEDEWFFKGIINYANGNRYEGELFEDEYNEKGIFIWANGERYEGDFVFGKQSGKGIFAWPSGDRYEGDFVNGNRTGKGIYIWANGGRYEGDFVDNLRTGKGIHTWPNGDRYEGDFKDDAQSGLGIKTYKNNVKYEGFFENDEAHGIGKIIWPNGDIFEGIFNCDLPDQKGGLTLAGGEFLEGVWNNGLLENYFKLKIKYIGNKNYVKKYFNLKKFLRKGFNKKINNFFGSKKISEKDKNEFKEAIRHLEDEINYFGAYLDEIQNEIDENITLDFETSEITRKELVKVSHFMKFQYLAERLSKKCVRKMYQAADEFKLIFEESVFPDDLH
jgi:putative phage-type endonuclease